MSIKFLKDQGHLPHVTGSNISIQTKFLMDVNDYFNGIGTLIDDQGIEIEDWILPTIGDKYIDFYFLDNLIGTYWEDVVLTDVTPDKTTARNTTDPVIVIGGWDLNAKVAVTFTWSNSGLKDIVTPGDESSMKIELQQNVQLETTDLIVNHDSGVVTSAADKYFEEKNTDIIFYSTDDNGQPTSENLGSYVGNTLENKHYHIQNNAYPAHEVYTTNTVLFITLYSKFNFNYLFADNENSVNNKDFLQQPYNERNARLAFKNKRPTDGANDLISVNDTGRWRFHNVVHTESGIDIHKYVLEFHYKQDKWNIWFGVSSDEYPVIDMYDTLIKPFFTTGS